MLVLDTLGYALALRYVCSLTICPLVQYLAGLKSAPVASVRREVEDSVTAVAAITVRHHTKALQTPDDISSRSCADLSRSNSFLLNLNSDHLREYTQTTLRAMLTTVNTLRFKRLSKPSTNNGDRYAFLWFQTFRHSHSACSRILLHSYDSACRYVNAGDTVRCVRSQ